MSVKCIWLCEIGRKPSEPYTMLQIAWFISGKHLLVIGKLMQEPADVADGEKSSGVQVGQNLHQDVWWQPATQVIKRSQKKEATPELPVLRGWEKCIYDRIKCPILGWCLHFADLACWEKSGFHQNQSNLESPCNQIRNLRFFLCWNCCNLLHSA